MQPDIMTSLLRALTYAGALHDLTGALAFERAHPYRNRHSDDPRADPVQER